MSTNQIKEHYELSTMDPTKLDNHVSDELSFVSALASAAIYDASVETAKNIAVWHSLNKDERDRIVKAAVQIAGLEWAKFNHEMCSRLNKSDDINRNYLEYALKAMRKHQPN